MIVSQIDLKGRTTIPPVICAALGMQAGDGLGWVIEGDRVILTRVSPEVEQDPLTLFDEWGGESDRRAFAEL